jgi:hypothetical protein
MMMASTHRKRSKPKPTALGWVGIVGDAIDLEYTSEVAGYGRVYKTRREAQNYYTSVRRVRLIVVT